MSQEQLKQKYKEEQESLWLMIEESSDYNGAPIDPSLCEQCCSNDTYFVQKLNGVIQECRSCEKHLQWIAQQNRR